MWPSLIRKAKEGGLDVIQTYVFWNLHEPQPGKVDLYLSVCPEKCVAASASVCPLNCSFWSHFSMISAEDVT